MKFKRTSPLTGKTTVREIPVDPMAVHEWESGSLIQDVMPELSEDDREWLMTGYTPEDWEQLFGDMDDE